MTLLKILFVSLLLIFGFAGYTTWGIPLIVPEAPPVEEKLTGDITMDQYIAIGRKIFEGKGTCTLCHSPVGGRAPLLDTIGALAIERVADADYSGAATDGEGYLRESLIDTSAYVVPGFGKTGTNDTISPMPDVSKGAIGLSEVELNAVIAFMQSSGGVDITVALPSGETEMEDEEEEETEITMAATPEEAFEKFECTLCHIFPNIEGEGDMGPDLTNIAKLASERKKGMSADAYLYESIVKPNEFIVEDFDEGMMPDDYPERMMLGELTMMINALMGREPTESGAEE